MTGRKVLLIVDNCPAHLKKGEIDLEKINVLDAIHFINVAWNIDVKPTTCKLFPILQNSTRGGYAFQTRNW
ncbi:hypothetical protein Gotri_015181 [Gossypium trilobum]|uniref:DDE-1 domain-containing protein n=1 Tax=Gossypium trilobum TaxID=34281 RepID=A0A7J9DZU8_9ROSI|nr:hypothetical protein [Gossypium trilobum]